MAQDVRRHPRQRVHLRVTYASAREFVEQYAANLSAGGVFLRGAHALTAGDEVTLALALPGHGEFTVGATAVHVTPAGAGLQLARPGPPGFAQALEAYLLRLGRRTGATVFVDVEPLRTLLHDAGYRIAPLPRPPQLAQVVADPSAVAVLAPQEHVTAYASALGFLGGAPTLVLGVHAKLPVEPVLAWLDDKLLAR